MTSRKLNRRDFLRASTLTVAGAALAGCACPSVAPEPEQVVITELVKQPGEQVEVEVTKIVTAVPEAAAGAEELTVYMQMGGQQGDPSTLARTNGARASAAHLGIKLIEQYSGWDAQTMIDQFKEAIAGEPDGIAIMGHPGEDAMGSLIDQAVGMGIVVTSGNNPLPTNELKYQTKGFGYAGANLYDGGYVTGLAMVAAGLQAGDAALVYDIWHQEGRSQSPQGIKDALEAAGVVVDTLDVTNDVDTDASLAIPILTAYMEANPDLKAIGTQHGNITSTLPKVLEAAGKSPGDVIIGGIDLSPATIDGIEQGWISASFDQVLYLQGYFPVQQIWLMANYLIPGLHINTGVGTVTPDNVGIIAPLIEAGIR
jgi:simple sugar transport system substrate-binding protein